MNDNVEGIVVGVMRDSQLGTLVSMTKVSGTPWKLNSRGHYSWIKYTVFKNPFASSLRSW